MEISAISFQPLMDPKHQFRVCFFKDIVNLTTQPVKINLLIAAVGAIEAAHKRPWVFACDSVYTCGICRGYLGNIYDGLACAFHRLHTAFSMFDFSFGRPYFGLLCISCTRI